MMTKDEATGLGIKQVASIAGTSALTVRRWLTAGDLAGVKVGDRGEWIISHDDLRIFLSGKGGRYADALRRWEADQAEASSDDVVQPGPARAHLTPAQAPDHVGQVIEALRAELAAKNQQMAAKDQQIADLTATIKRRDEREDQLLKMLPAPVSDQAEPKASPSWWGRLLGRKQ